MKKLLQIAVNHSTDVGFIKNILQNHILFKLMIQLYKAKLISMSILQVKKYYQIIEQAKFTYSPLGKAFEIQT